MWLSDTRMLYTDMPTAQLYTDMMNAQLYTDAICTGAANSWYLMFDVFRFQPRYKHDSKIFYESSVLSGSLGG